MSRGKKRHPNSAPISYKKCKKKEKPQASSEDKKSLALPEEKESTPLAPEKVGTALPEEKASAIAPQEYTKPTEEQEPEFDDEAQKERGDPNKSIMEHLSELRSVLFRSLIALCVGFCLCWGFVEQLFNIIVQPLLDTLPSGCIAIYTTLPEAFFVRMIIALLGGFFIVSPYIFYKVWEFISPALYKEERKFIVLTAIVSAIFFVGGALFCYFIIFHYAFSFFMSFSSGQVQNQPRIGDYLELVIKLIFAFGLVFEMPIFSFFLSRMGVLTAKAMRTARRYAVLIIFILAAILTPPDVVSQLLMAVPMLILYEVSIVIAAICGKKKPKEDADATES